MQLLAAATADIVGNLIASANVTRLLFALCAWLAACAGHHHQIAAGVKSVRHKEYGVVRRQLGVSNFNDWPVLRQ